MMPIRRNMAATFLASCSLSSSTTHAMAHGRGGRFCFSFTVKHSHTGKMPRFQLLPGAAVREQLPDVQFVTVLAHWVSHL